MHIVNSNIVDSWWRAYDKRWRKYYGWIFIPRMATYSKDILIHEMGDPFFLFSFIFFFCVRWEWVFVTTLHNRSLILQLNDQWIIVTLISTFTPPTVPVVNSFPSFVQVSWIWSFLVRKTKYKNIISELRFQTKIGIHFIQGPWCCEICWWFWL